jgi:hypothetical protein
MKNLTQFIIIWKCGPLIKMQFIIVEVKVLIPNTCNLYAWLGTIG